MNENCKWKISGERKNEMAIDALNFANLFDVANYWLELACKSAIDNSLLLAMKYRTGIVRHALLKNRVKNRKIKNKE